MAQRRTPEQLIADHEAKIAKLAEKAAVTRAKDNPLLETLVDLLEGAGEKIRESQRVLGDGAQSLNARRTKHAAWLAELDAAETLAEANQETYQIRKDEIMRSLPTIAGYVSEGKESEARDLIDAVEEKVLEIQTDIAIITEYEARHASRLAVTNSKKLSS